MTIGKQYLYIPNRVIDSRGLSIAASIYFYQTGTMDKIDVFSDQALTSPVNNPFIVDAGATIPEFFYDPALTIRVRVVAVTGEIVSDDDPWQGFDIANFMFTQSGTGAVTQTISSRLSESLLLTDFGTTAAAFRAAATEAMSSGRILRVPKGTYSISTWTSPIVTTAPLVIVGDGPQVSILDCTGATKSLVHALHDVTFIGLNLINHNSPSSGNGGAYIYNLDSTDSGIASITAWVVECEFNNSTAPINIESPHHDCLFETVTMDGIVGYPIRMGTNDPTKYPTWVNTRMHNLVIRNVTSTGSTQNVGGFLIYGTDPNISNFYIDGVVGGGAGTSEAWGGYIKTVGGLVSSGVVKNISGGNLTNRCFSCKGSMDSRFVHVSDLTLYGNGTAEGYSHHGGEMQASNLIIYDPLVAGVTIGSASGNGSSKLMNIQIFGTSRASVQGIVGVLDDGVFEIRGAEITGLADRPLALALQTGCDSLLMSDLNLHGNAGTSQIYCTNAITAVVVESGEIEITNNGYCLELAGPGSITTADIRLTKLKSVSGFGVAYNVPITTLNHANAMCSGMSAGREILFSVVPTSMIVNQTFSLTTSNATPVAFVTWAPPAASAVTLSVVASAKSSANQGSYSRIALGTSAAGTASVVGHTDLHTAESAGAAAWEVSIAAATSTLFGQVTGAAATSITWRGQYHIIQQG